MVAGLQVVIEPSVEPAIYYKPRGDNMMNESNQKPLVIAFVIVVVLFLIFGGGAMSGSMMNGGMMGQGWNGGLRWMWIPALFTLGLGLLLGWVIFGQKNR